MYNVFCTSGIIRNLEKEPDLYKTVFLLCFEDKQVLTYYFSYQTLLQRQNDIYHYIFIRKPHLNSLKTPRSESYVPHVSHIVKESELINRQHSVSYKPKKQIPATCRRKSFQPPQAMLISEVRKVHIYNICIPSIIWLVYILPSFACSVPCAIYCKLRLRHR